MVEFMSLEEKMAYENSPIDYTEVRLAKLEKSVLILLEEVQRLKQENKDLKYRLGLHRSNISI